MEKTQFVPRRTPGVFKTTNKKLHDRLTTEGFETVLEEKNERGFTVWGYKPCQELKDAVDFFRLDNPTHAPTTKLQEENTHDII
jgi:hypothetical protein